ncbi:MAG: DUF4062 domain-containing protein [Bacteroidetes bacterium]|nr:DUF4062 domain-containing protein [Bacteroidota bacterium]
MKRVYISSTFNDLKEHRDKAGVAVRKMGLLDVAMEYYNAEDKRPVDKCLEDVRSCEVYIGIFAWRYGWEPEEENPEKYSITRMEYEEARKTGKKIFIYLLDGKHPWPPELVDENRGVIKRLRDELSERHGCALFTTPDSLAAQVSASLSMLTGDAPPPEDMGKYMERLANRYRRIDLEGLTPPEKEDHLQLQLRIIFVEQHVRDNRPPIELPKDIWSTLQLERELCADDLPAHISQEEIKKLSDTYYGKKAAPVLEMLTDPANPHVIILGDPGSGKSTLLKYMALSMIDASINPRLHSFYLGAFPLLIELRSYIALKKKYQDCRTFLDFCDHLSESQSSFPDKKALLRHLSERKPTLLLFDGLDEIFDPADRETITREIVGFTEKYPDVRVIVTSRIIGYQRSILMNAGFKEFTLQDFDEKQVNEFVYKWYSIVLADRPQEAQARVKRIQEAFKTAASIRQLSGNPMLLTIMAIIGKNQELPRERWKLYEHAASVLIEHWDINRHLKANHVEADFIGGEEKKEILRRLAFKMQSGEGGLAGNYIHKERLQEEIEEYLRERYQKIPDAARIARSMIQQFRERNFILSLYGGNLFGFVHRGFLEYFCAMAFIQKFEKTRELSFEQLRDEVFGEHCDDPSWHEVLRIIAGVVAEGFTADIILFLAKRSWSEDQAGNGKFPYFLSLALKCLAEVRNLQMMREPCKFLLERVFNLFNLTNRPNDGYFSFIEEDIITPILTIDSSWPCVDVLTDFLKISRPNVKYYSIEKLLGKFIGQVGKNEMKIKKNLFLNLREMEFFSRAMVPFALVQGWREDPDVFPLLKKLALDDKEVVMRYVCTEALFSEYKNEPGMRELLIYQVKKDKEPLVNLIGMMALATNYKGDPEVFDILKKELLDKKPDNNHVRIIQLVTQHFADNDELLEFLCQLAQKGGMESSEEMRTASNYYVRETSMQRLLERWPSHPKTLEVLKKIAENDPFPWMRERAAEMLKKL